MASTIRFIGLEKVVANLNNEIAKIQNASVEGLTLAVIHIYNTSVPLTPVITGNLRSSGFILTQRASMGGAPTAEAVAAVSKSTRSNPVAAIGYSAEYSLFVHENIRAGNTGGFSPQGKKYKRWSTVGQWKFLEQPFITERKTVLEIIRGRIRIP